MQQCCKYNNTGRGVFYWSTLRLYRYYRTEPNETENWRRTAEFSSVQLEVRIVPAECPVKEDDSESDSDLWTAVTSCIRVQWIRSSNPKPILLVMQIPDTWKYNGTLVRNLVLMVLSNMIWSLLWCDITYSGRYQHFSSTAKIKGAKFLWKVGIYLPKCMVPYPRW
jgi:hypothetical protein